MNHLSRLFLRAPVLVSMWLLVLLLWLPGSAGAVVAPGFPLQSSQSSPVTGAVTISASLTVEPGLLGVQFKLDGYVLDALVSTSPFQVVWSAASASNGEHTITAEARYSSGTAVESATLRLTVANPETFNRLLYVDSASGNDGNDGLSPTTAWQTLAQANASVQAGDTVYLKGTFGNQELSPAVSGTAARPITFKRNPGQTAVLNGVGPNGVTVWLPGRSFVIVDALEIRNGTYVALLLDSGSHHVVVRNCTLTNDSAIFIEQASDNVIEANTLVDVGREADNAGDAIWVVNGSSRNKILRNTLTRAGHMLIGVGGDRAGDADVLDNVVAHNVGSNPWAGGISVNWKAKRTLVERNQVSDAGTSPTSVAWSRNGIQIYARENIVRYNEFFNNAWNGIELGAYVFGGSIIQDSIANQVYHNVSYGNGQYGLHLFEQNGRSVRDNLIINNIFFRNAGLLFEGDRYTIVIDQYNTSTPWPVGSFNGNQLKNNIILRQPGAAGERLLLRIRTEAQGGNLKYTLAQFEAAHAGAADNVEADPQFTDEANRVFTLRPGSPAIDRGMVLSGLVYQGLAPDIGAYESSAGTPRAPENLQLTRFGGHPIVGAERKVHDADESLAVPAGSPAADDRVGSARPDTRGAVAGV